MTFREPTDAFIELSNTPDGWTMNVWTDNKPRAHIGPFRGQQDPADFMLWLMEAFAQLEVRVYPEVIDELLDDLRMQDIDKRQLERINRRRSGKPDLYELLRDKQEESYGS